LTNQKLAVATHLCIRRRASRFFGTSGNPESELRASTNEHDSGGDVSAAEAWTFQKILPSGRHFRETVESVNTVKGGF
jgi:hypothetical protein